MSTEGWLIAPEAILQQHEVTHVSQYEATRTEKVSLKLTTTSIQKIVVSTAASSQATENCSLGVVL
jgi:ATP-dependent protease HslVU (ClpYQ) ATPase subunit